MFRSLSYNTWILLAALATTAFQANATTDSEVWVRPKAEGDPLIWGRKDGIIFGLPSKGGMRGPRGLIRIGIIGRTSGRPELINFIAVEPVTTGTGARHMRLALSELEMSQLDPDKRGKRMWTDSATGELTTGSRETLSVRIEVEPFTANRAHVYVIARMHADRPEELELTVHHHEDSAPIDELTLTATMGNKERLRQLWLKDGVIDSRELFAGYEGVDFIEKKPYPMDRMLNWQGDPVAIATTNEANPTGVPVPGAPSWMYVSVKLTQYWRVPAAHVQPNLRVRVNGRRVYWSSEVPIPGGISFENFEVQQRYVPGQQFVFGMTQKEPKDFQPPVAVLPQAPGQ